MTRLQVETADFHEAATTMRHNVAESVRICLEGLSFSPELVGEDPAGDAWSSAYDPAARAVLRTTAQISNAAARVSLLLAHSGDNYARAEAASDAGGGSGGGTDFGDLLRPLPHVTAPAMPRSGGAGNGTPEGWWLIENTIGYVWPGGHQDRLRNTANEWRSAAGGLENVAFDPVVAASIFARDRLPESDDVATVCVGVNKRLEALVRSYHALADACDDYADHLDQCHDAIRDELSDLLRDSGIAQGAGAVLAVFTLGGSEIAAQGAQAGRVAAAAVEVSSLIERMIMTGRRIAILIERVHNVVQEINSALGPLLDIPVVYADVTNVRNIPRVGGTPVRMSPTQNEAAAAARIAQGGRVKRPLNAAERKHILDGDEKGGGHRWPGKPGAPGKPRKSPFPKEWSDDQILGNVEDIVHSPTTTWRVQSGSTSLYNRSGQPSVWRAWEVRDGKQIRVAWEPATGHVRTAFPDPGNPKGQVVP